MVVRAPVDPPVNDEHLQLPDPFAFHSCPQLGARCRVLRECDGVTGNGKRRWRNSGEEQQGEATELEPETEEVRGPGSLCSCACWDTARLARCPGKQAAGGSGL